MIELLVAILAFLCILGSAFVGFMINSRLYYYESRFKPAKW